MRFGNDPDHSGSWDMSDSDFSKEEMESGFRERATNPDLAFAAEIARRREAQIKAARRDLIKKLNNPSSYSLRREVEYRILERNEFSPNEIKMLNMASSGGRDTFMEFRGAGSNIHYIYFTEDFENPFCTISGDNRIPMNHPGATVLMRVDWWNNASEELYRWEEDDKDE